MYHSELYELIHLLNSPERQQCQALFKKEGSRNEDEVFLPEKLFNFLASCKSEPDNAKAINEIYGAESGSSATYRKLIYRTRNKALGFIVTFSNENEKNDDQANVKQKVIKKTLAFQMLRLKGKKIKLLDTLLDEIITTSIEYEFYPTLLEYLFFKKTIIGLKEGDTKTKKINDQINHYLHCYKSLVNASEMNHRLKFLDGQSAVNFQIENLEMEIEILKIEADLTRAPLIRHFQLYHEMAFFNYKNQYIKALEIGNEILDFIKKNKSLKRQDRLGCIYANLGNTEMHLLNFSKAQEYFNSTLLYSKRGTRNYYINIELIFICNFFLKNFKETNKYLTILNSETNLSLFNEHELSRFKFYKVYFLLATGNYKKALQNIMMKGEVSKDTTGWDFWYRILFVMLNLYLNNKESAMNALKNLRKQISRVSKTKSFRQRDVEIFKLLILLSKKDFTYQPEIIKKHFSFIKKSKLFWQPVSAELIPFEDLLAIKYPELKVIE